MVRKDLTPTSCDGPTMTMERVLRYPISTDLGRLRDLVSAYAVAGGLRGERLMDLVLAVNEAVTNVLDHGGAAARSPSAPGPAPSPCTSRTWPAT
ncbi:ATP-binding protein [Nonomuraea thailandensis]